MDSYRNEIARPTSADMHAIQHEDAAGRRPRIGKPVFVQDVRASRGYVSVTDEGAEGCVGVLATRGDASEPKRGTHTNPDSVVALSGPMTVRVTDQQNEDALNRLGLEGIALPSINGRYEVVSRDPLVRERNLNYLMYDKLHGDVGILGASTNKSAFVVMDRTFLSSRRRQLETNGRAKKYSSLLSAHPFDVVCVKHPKSHICMGDLVMQVCDAPGVPKVYKDGRCIVCSIADMEDLELDEPYFLCMGVAISDHRQSKYHESIPVRVGGIVSLNDSYKCLRPLDEGSSLVPRAPPAVAADWEIGTKYEIMDAEGVDLHSSISGMMIQPIRVIKASSKLSRALMFHARIGTLCV